MNEIRLFWNSLQYLKKIFIRWNDSISEHVILISVTKCSYRDVILNNMQYSCFSYMLLKIKLFLGIIRRWCRNNRTRKFSAVLIKLEWRSYAVKTAQTLHNTRYCKRKSCLRFQGNFYLSRNYSFFFFIDQNYDVGGLRRTPDDNMMIVPFGTIGYFFAWIFY